MELKKLMILTVEEGAYKSRIAIVKATEGGG
jgi:hypothetical protein